MNDKIVSYDTAVLAKQKGYSDPIGSENLYYDRNTKYIHPYLWFHPHELADPIYAVQQSVLQKWIREEHHMHISIDYDSKGWSFSTVVMNEDGGYVDWSSDYETYEECLEAGLVHVLKSIKSIKL